MEFSFIIHKQNFMHGANCLIFMLFILTSNQLFVFKDCSITRQTIYIYTSFQSPRLTQLRDRTRKAHRKQKHGGVSLIFGVCHPSCVMLWFMGRCVVSSGSYSADYRDVHTWLRRWCAAHELYIRTPWVHHNNWNNGGYCMCTGRSSMFRNSWVAQSGNCAVTTRTWIIKSFHHCF